MPVTCVQIYFRPDAADVEVSYLIPPPEPGMTDQQILDFKGARAEADGWTVDWAQNRRSFQAEKIYSPDTRKTRTFRRAG